MSATMISRRSTEWTNGRWPRVGRYEQVLDLGRSPLSYQEKPFKGGLSWLWAWLREAGK
jgi:hypothetical protein